MTESQADNIFFLIWIIIDQNFSLLPFCFQVFVVIVIIPPLGIHISSTPAYHIIISTSGYMQQIVQLSHFVLIIITKAGNIFIRKYGLTGREGPKFCSSLILTKVSFLRMQPDIVMFECAKAVHGRTNNCRFVRIEGFMFFIYIRWVRVVWCLIGNWYGA